MLCVTDLLTNWNRPHAALFARQGSGRSADEAYGLCLSLTSGPTYPIYPIKVKEPKTQIADQFSLHTLLLLLMHLRDFWQQH